VEAHHQWLRGDRIVLLADRRGDIAASGKGADPKTTGGQDGNSELLSPLGRVHLPVAVALVDLALIRALRRLPSNSVPWGTAGVATGLAILATAAAAHTGITRWLTAPDTFRQALLGAGSANVLNNLPAFLLGLPQTTSVNQVLALLLGVNLGPTVLVTGSLAGLLWLDSARRCGLDANAREYARVGLIAGVPALLAAISVLALLT